MQVGWLTKVQHLMGLPESKTVNTVCAILVFFSFLKGLYALSFSKEKFEDEMIKHVRLESFQFSALLQIIIIGLGITWIGFMDNPPKDAGVLLFFIFTLLLFWIIYICRFNYIVHIGIYKNEK